MPQGPAKQTVSARDLQRLHSRIKEMEKREAALHNAELEWARFVREIGVSAVARELDWSRQRLDARLRTIEARATRANGHNGEQ